MKVKEKWAIQDAAKIMGYTEQRVIIQGQGDIRWWLSGFDYCKKQLAIALLRPDALNLGESDAGPEPVSK